ncbi:hypothetical protein FB451DRAFT_1375190, partial [Mycena latifolia]
MLAHTAQATKTSRRTGWKTPTTLGKCNVLSDFRTLSRSRGRGGSAPRVSREDLCAPVCHREARRILLHSSPLSPWSPSPCLPFRRCTRGAQVRAEKLRIRALSFRVPSASVLITGCTANTCAPVPGPAGQRSLSWPRTWRSGLPHTLEAGRRVGKDEHPLRDERRHTYTSGEAVVAKGRDCSPCATPARRNAPNPQLLGQRKEAGGSTRPHARRKHCIRGARIARCGIATARASEIRLLGGAARAGEMFYPGR